MESFGESYIYVPSRCKCANATALQKGPSIHRQLSREILIHNNHKPYSGSHHTSAELGRLTQDQEIGKYTYAVAVCISQFQNPECVHWISTFHVHKGTSMQQQGKFVLPLSAANFFFIFLVSKASTPQTQHEKWELIPENPFPEIITMLLKKAILHLHHYLSPGKWREPELHDSYINNLAVENMVGEDLNVTDFQNTLKNQPKGPAVTLKG